MKITNKLEMYFAGKFKMDPIQRKLYEMELENRSPSGEIKERKSKRLSDKFYFKNRRNNFEIKKIDQKESKLPSYEFDNYRKQTARKDADFVDEDIRKECMQLRNDLIRYLGVYLGTPIKKQEMITMKRKYLPDVSELKESWKFGDVQIPKEILNELHNMANEKSYEYPEGPTKIKNLLFDIGLSFPESFFALTKYFAELNDFNFSSYDLFPQFNSSYTNALSKITNSIVQDRMRRKKEKA